MSRPIPEQPHFPPAVISRWVTGAAVSTKELTQELRTWLDWLNWDLYHAEPIPDEKQSGAKNEIQPDVRCKFIWPFQRHVWSLWSEPFQVRTKNLVWSGKVVGYNTETQQKKICEHCGKVKIRTISAP